MERASVDESGAQERTCCSPGVWLPRRSEEAAAGERKNGERSQQPDAGAECKRGRQTALPDASDEELRGKCKYKQVATHARGEGESFGPRS